MYDEDYIFLNVSVSEAHSYHSQIGTDAIVWQSRDTKSRHVQHYVQDMWDVKARLVISSWANIFYWSLKFLNFLKWK